MSPMDEDANAGNATEHAASSVAADQSPGAAQAPPPVSAAEGPQLPRQAGKHRRLLYDAPRGCHGPGKLDVCFDRSKVPTSDDLWKARARAAVFRD
jgi:hypothetical protein